LTFENFRRTHGPASPLEIVFGENSHKSSFQSFSLFCRHAKLEEERQEFLKTQNVQGKITVKRTFENFEDF